MAQKNNSSSMQASALRVTRIGFYFAALFMAVIVVSDAWNLIAPETVIQRWSLAVVMLLVTTLSWYVLKTTKASNLRVKALLWLQITMYVIVATVTVYAQRGVASRGVVLYVVPIVISAALASRAATYAAATLSVAAYSLASIRYFYLNYGEAYKVELYGELIFYCGVLFVIAALILAALRSRGSVSS